MPTNTSASFLNQKQDVERLLEKQDRVQNQRTQGKERERCSLSSSSVGVPDDCGGRSEDPRHCYNSYKTQAGSSRTEKPHKSERHFSTRRTSSDSFYRNSEDKVKTYGYRRAEKDMEGRRDHYKGWEPSSVSRSPPASADHSWKAFEKHKKPMYAAARDCSRQEQRGPLSSSQGERGGEGSCGEDKPEALGERLDSGEQSESRAKKNLPQNLLNIFNQIAEFEKEKGNKPKN